MTGDKTHKTITPNTIQLVESLVILPRKSLYAAFPNTILLLLLLLLLLFLLLLIKNVVYSFFQRFQNVPLEEIEDYLGIILKLCLL